MPTVGFIGSVSAKNYSSNVDGFRQGLAEAGYVDGRDVAIELRWADGEYERLPALAADFIKQRVDVIFAGSLPAAIAAKKATSTIPIVFIMGADPVKLGIVASMRQPGGNITGVSQLLGALGAKRLEILREVVPNAGLVAIISNPQNPNARDHLKALDQAARDVKQKTVVLNASNEAGIAAAFASVASHRAGAVLVADDPFFNVKREQFVELANRHAVPTIYYVSEFTQAGGLMSYGPNIRESYRLGAGYVAKILQGTKPAELPVLQPTTFELVVNTKTARTLGIKIPNSILVRADRVIE